MSLRHLINIAYAALTEGMDEAALVAWHAKSEPKAGQDGEVKQHQSNPQNRNVAALMAVSKSMPRTR